MPIKSYVKRTIEKELRSLFHSYPVVVITGPRQSGKTTLAARTFPDLPYFNLEAPDIREVAHNDPRAFLAGHEKGCIIDEIQREPLLLSYIQETVDRRNRNGQFILTGSSQFPLRDGVSQSLAGRAALLTLLPFSIGELESVFPVQTTDRLIHHGFYPRIYHESLDPLRAFRNYVETYVQRDVRSILNIKDLRLFQKFLKLCAGRIGRCFSASSLASEVGVSVPTIQAWLSILEASYIVFMLEPFFDNVNKRLVKSPKLYFYDTGLAAFLLGIESDTQIGRDPLRGELFENLVVAELLKLRFNQGLGSNLFFYRDNHGNEVDVVLQNGNSLSPVEIKSSQTWSQDFLKGLRHFNGVFGERSRRGYVVYSGTMETEGKDYSVLNFRMAEKIRGLIR